MEDCYPVHCIGLNRCRINNPVEVAVGDLAAGLECVSKMSNLFSVYFASNLTCDGTLVH